MFPSILRVFLKILLVHSVGHMTKRILTKHPVQGAVQHTNAVQMSVIR